MGASWYKVVSGIMAAPVPSPKTWTKTWESIMAAESGNRPAIINPKGATGLFQLLPTGGQGAGYTTAQLQNPATNARLAKGQMLAAYKQGYALGFRGASLAEYTATHSGHPGTAPTGSILPPTSWASFGQFAQEAANIGSAYAGSAARGAMQASQQHKSPTQAVAQGPWHSALQTLYSIEQTGIDVIHPFNSLHKVLFMLGIFLLALIMIGVGALAVTGIGVKDLIELAA